MLFNRPTHVNHGTNMELDALVVAPHPDDAELGMGGACWT